MKSIAPSHASDEVLAQAILDKKIPLNRWNEKVDQWICRVRKARELYPDKDFPEYNEEEIQLIYLELCSGLTKAKEIRDLECLDYVKNLLSWDDQRFIEDALPEKLELSNGTKLKIIYEEGQEIKARAFIQQLFDLQDTPLLGPARIPLKLEILAPNHRPIQVTKNLANFWTTLYPEIKPGLARRYHKHKWI